MKRLKNPGFTLIELLVVISIISLLISVLLPALGGARQTADSIDCLSKMRGLGFAQTQYATDFKGWMPFGTWDPDGAGVAFTASSWPNSTVNPGTSTLDRACFQNNSIYYQGYLQFSESWSGPMMCPTYAKDGILPNRQTTGAHDLKVSYTYNMHVGSTYAPVGSTTATWLYKPVMIDDVKKPSDRSFLIDGTYRQTTKLNYAVISFTTPFLSSDSSPMGRHIGGTDNIVFIDGHATNRKSLETFANQTFWTSYP